MHGEHESRPGGLERLGDVPREALVVADTRDQRVLAAQIERNHDRLAEGRTGVRMWARGFRFGLADPARTGKVNEETRSGRLRSWSYPLVRFTIPLRRQNNEFRQECSRFFLAPEAYDAHHQRQDARENEAA